MKHTSITRIAGAVLFSLMGVVPESYAQSPAPAQPGTATAASNAIQEALRANPQAAAIASGRAGKIVGGDPVTIADNPWQVALVRGNFAEPQRSQFCGGSLIRPDWVLTAAHCIRNTIVREDPARLNIVVGPPQFFLGGERLTVAAIHVHPQYKEASNDFDFALVRLSRPVTTGGTSVARPIELVDANTQLPEDTASRVTGWGATSEASPGSLDLLGVEVPIVSTTVCNRPESYNGDIPNMLCAGREAGGVDSCQGDIG